MLFGTHCNETNTAEDPFRLSLEALIDTRYASSYLTIRESAMSLLGPYYADLKKFYSDIFLSRQPQYFVFVARRSIGLAELFLIILWHENKEPAFRNQLEFCWANSSTDTSILSYTSKIAADLVYNYPPKITVIDDLLVQGNGLNEFISTLETELLVELVKITDEFSAVRYLEDILNSMQLRVFAQNDKLSVLRLQYQPLLRPMRRMPPKQWHNLSRRISTLLYYAGTANASFIMGAEVSSNSQIQNMLKTGIPLPNNGIIPAVIENRGRFAERCYFGWFDPRQLQPKFYCSIRVIRNCFTNTYLLLPFVFLPKLSPQSYSLLKTRIQRKWCPDKILSGFFSSTERTSRLEYEAMMLHLSESLLMCWTQVCGISLLNEDYIPTKVALNYGTNRKHPVMDKGLLNRLSNSEYLFSWSELTELLNEVTKDSESLIPHLVPSTISNEIVHKKMEDTIYLIKVEELYNSYHTRSHYVKRKNSQNQLYKKNDWNISLERFTSEICNSIQGVSVESLFRYLLSFMDLGILTLKTRSFDSLFTQVIRMGEQSLFIWPQRYAVYHPMLSYLENRCKRSNTSLNDDLLLFLNYQQSHGKLESNIDAKALTAELIEYLKTLRDSGQDPVDWDIGLEKPLLLDLSSRDTDDEFRQLYLRERQQYMDAARIRWGLLDDCCAFFSY